MRRIAIINQKGGVGKTTTTTNLGAALAIQGRRVVVVDMDAQANLSLSLGVEAPSDSPTSYSVLTGATRFGGSLRDTAIPRLRLLPANLDLSGAELELASAMGREFVMRDALREWVEEERARTGRAPADYVLFDCPPSLGLLSINALASAGEVLVTLQTEFLALQGMSKLIEVVQLLRRRLNPELTITGILPCLYDSRLRLAREVLGEIRAYFQGQVLPHPIRASVKLAESPSFGQTVFEYAPDSNGAEDYMRLAREVIAREALDPELAGLPAFDPEARLAPKTVAPPRPPPPRRAAKAVAIAQPPPAQKATVNEPAPAPKAPVVQPVVAAPTAAAGRAEAAEHRRRERKAAAGQPAANAPRQAAPTPTAPADAAPSGTAPQRAAPKPQRASTGKAKPAKPPAPRTVTPPPASERKASAAAVEPARAKNGERAPAAGAPRPTEPRVLRADDLPPLPPDAFEILSILPTDP